MGRRGAEVGRRRHPHRHIRPAVDVGARVLNRVKHQLGIVPRGGIQSLRRNRTKADVERAAHDGGVGEDNAEPEADTSGAVRVGLAAQPACVRIDKSTDSRISDRSVVHSKGNRWDDAKRKECSQSVLVRKATDGDGNGWSEQGGLRCRAGCGASSWPGRARARGAARRALAAAAGPAQSRRTAGSWTRCRGPRQGAGRCRGPPALARCSRRRIDPGPASWAAYPPPHFLRRLEHCSPKQLTGTTKAEAASCGIHRRQGEVRAVEEGQPPLAQPHPLVARDRRQVKGPAAKARRQREARAVLTGRHSPLSDRMLRRRKGRRSRARARNHERVGLTKGQ